MIVTLTPNPSLDRTIEVERLEVGQVHRALGIRVDPGGKGVNVSRALAANGRRTAAVLPAAGGGATQFAELLDDAGVEHDFVPLDDALRTNITLVESDGTTTKINEKGRRSSAADAEAMLAAVSRRLDDARWLVGSGSLPPGLDASLYTDLVALGRSRGVRVAIDTSGPALAVAVEAQPDLIKPNHEELEELVGAALPTVGDVLDAARALVAAGIGAVVVSLGSDGALAVDAARAVHVRGIVERPLSTVGAGDCLLAGWLAATAEGAPLDVALTTGVRWGSAAVALPGSRVPSPADLSLASVTEPREPASDTALTDHPATPATITEG
ncbi:1-phosphofructokinase [Demequina sp. NBRC 110052]|uniref:1-phosphofructokinase n=1 Tax=Demequina sp. NBRC 110052 TaxID=1570341 RepID=UPI000A025ADA|nr:1-phosphofructokinase [Demequina sp. NBRC 110052]